MIYRELGLKAKLGDTIRTNDGSLMVLQTHEAVRDYNGAMEKEYETIADQLAPQNVPVPHDGFGSFRRAAEAYWKGQMTSAQERQFEDRTPKEILIGYKPIV